MKKISEYLKEYIKLLAEKTDWFLRSRFPRTEKYLLWAENRFPYLFTRIVIITASVVLILFLMVIRSNFAKPGSYLYLVKVYVAEKVGNIFAFTKYQQAERARRLDNDRLTEAVKLLSRDDLSKNRSQILTKLFTENAARVSQVIASVKANKNIAEAETIANRFEADLLGFEAVFLNLRQVRDNGPADLDSLGARLDEKLATIKKMRIDLDNSLAADNSNNSFQNQTDETVEETKNTLLQTEQNLPIIQNNLKKGELTLFNNHLVSTRDLIAQSQDKQNQKLFGEALVLASQAYREARTAQIFATVLSGSSF